MVNIKKLMNILIKKLLVIFFLLGHIKKNYYFEIKS